MSSCGVPMVLAQIMPRAIDHISAFRPYLRIVTWLPRILATIQMRYTQRKATKKRTTLKPMKMAPMLHKTARARPRMIRPGMRLKGFTSFFEASAVAFLAFCQAPMASVAWAFRLSSLKSAPAASAWAAVAASRAVASACLALSTAGWAAALRALASASDRYRASSGLLFQRAGVLRTSISAFMAGSFWPWIAFWAACALISSMVLIGLAFSAFIIAAYSLYFASMPLLLENTRKMATAMMKKPIQIAQ